MVRHEQFPSALEALHQAINKLVDGDPEPIQRLHSKSDDLTAFYGWGGYERGYESIAARWAWGSQKFHGGKVSYETIATVVTADMAYAMELETFSVRFGDQKESKTWTNNVTHVFIREPEGWAIIHRHAHPQADPPSS